MNKSPESPNTAKIANFHTGSLSYTNTIFFIKIVFLHINIYYQRSQQAKIFSYRVTAKKILIHRRVGVFLNDIVHQIIAW